MTNWIKYVSLPLVLLIGMFLGSYWNKPVNAGSNSILMLNAGSGKVAPYTYEMIDPKTHVHYLVIEPKYNDGISITPRLDKNGKPIIK